MEIRLSRTVSYCPGVGSVIKLARSVLETAKERGVGAYCVGSLVHNQKVQDSFAENGLEFISSPEGHKPGIALISAHGIPEALRRDFKKAGFVLIDGTCPTISKNVELIRKKARTGRFLVVIGIPGHSETNCLLGTEIFEGVPIPSVLIATENDIDKIPAGIPLFVIAQTTAKKEVFDRLSTLVAQRFKDVEICRSLCVAPLVRQKHVLELCGKCDAVVVVGGAKSANTLALVDLVVSQGVKAFRVEEPSEIPAQVYSLSTVGVAAGSSTPRQELDAVAQALRMGGGGSAQS